MIAAQFEGFEKLFHPNELAYYALTSQVEILIRDKLAFRLHELGERVRREWRAGESAGRADLVMFRAGCRPADPFR